MLQASSPDAGAQVGVALFKDHPNALFPFSAMDAAQRQYVEGVVAGCMSQFQQRDACAAAGVAQQPPVSANVVMQMGGGCILYAENAAAATRDCGAGPCGSGERRPSGASFLRPKDVFETLCDCIFASRRWAVLPLLVIDHVYA